MDSIGVLRSDLTRYSGRRKSGTRRHCGAMQWSRVGTPALQRRRDSKRATNMARPAIQKNALTMAQALVKYLCVQFSERDGGQRRLIPGIFGIFGHGNVAGLGQALYECGQDLPYYQPRNEQSMVHTAIGYAKASGAWRRSPARPRSGRAQPTWSPARRWRPSIVCPCCCCPPITTPRAPGPGPSAAGASDFRRRERQ